MLCTYASKCKQSDRQSITRYLQTAGKSSEDYSTNQRSRHLLHGRRTVENVSESICDWSHVFRG